MSRPQPDYTGFYEQILTDDERRHHATPASLQICVAGDAIVGWFAVGAGTASADVSSWPRGPGTSWIRSGAFIVDTSRPAAGSVYRFRWWQEREPRATPIADPDRNLTQFGAAEFYGGTGVLAIDDNGRATVFTIKFAENSSRADRFRRYSPTARPSNRAIADAPAPYRAEMQVQYVQPLPPSWIDGAADYLLGSSALTAITEWKLKKDNILQSRAALTAAVETCLLRFRDVVVTLPLPHQRYLVNRVSNVVKTLRLTIRDETASLWTWYNAVATDIRDSGSLGLTNSAAWRLLDITLAGTSDGYVCVCNFNKLALPGTRSEVSDRLLGKELGRQLEGVLNWSFPFLNVHAGGVVIDIEIYEVKFQMKAGRPVLDDLGQPIPIRPDGTPLDVTTLNSATAKRTGKLLGGYLEAGAGLSVKAPGGEVVKALKNQSLQQLRNAFQGTFSASQSTLGKSIFIVHRGDSELTVEDFGGASFRVAGFRPIKIELGTASAEYFSAFREITLTDGRTLSSFGSPAFNASLFPDWGIVYGGPLEWMDAISKVAVPTAAFQLMEIGMSFGHILDTRAAPAEKVPPRTSESTSVDTPAAQTAVVYFLKDSAEVVSSGQFTSNVIQQLNIALATARYLITGTGARSVQCRGFASPEYTYCHNLALSQDRAETVQAIVERAFVGRPVQPVVAIGLGEDPALDIGGLDDPGDTSAERAAFEKKYPNQVRQWRKWRRVDITVDGHVVVEVTESP